jgi:hypothetical protein
MQALVIAVVVLVVVLFGIGWILSVISEVFKSFAEKRRLQSVKSNKKRWLLKKRNLTPLKNRRD